MKITELVPDAKNANKGTQRGLRELDKSLRRNGAGRSILIDRNNKIIAGNKTTERAVDIGLEDVIIVESDGTKLVAVKRTDLDLDNGGAARELAYADNWVAQVDLDWNADQVLADLEAGSAALQEMLRELAEHARIEIPGDVAEDPGAQLDRAEELREKWQTETGQLWQVGEHKILCGDCTKAEDVQRLMGGEKANCLFTSPPYWIGKEYEIQTSETEIDNFISCCVKAWTDYVNVDMGRICINTGSAAIHRIEKGRRVEVLPLIDKWQKELKQRGWLARHWRIWAKSGDFPASISPKSDVVDQHWENIVTFDNEFSFLGTWWSPVGDQRGQEKIGTKWAQQGVWHDVPGERSGNGNHIAAFPVELPKRNIMLYAQPKEIVLDPFLGSGTTLVACQQLGRKGRGIEIDAGYVAVSLERLAGMGLTPELIT